MILLLNYYPGLRHPVHLLHPLHRIVTELVDDRPNDPPESRFGCGASLIVRDFSIRTRTGRRVMVGETQRSQRLLATLRFIVCFGDRPHGLRREGAEGSAR